MNDESKKEREGRFQSDGGGLASRARNRTVLLTPETVGQVRASLGDEEAGAGSDPMNELLPPTSGGWDYPGESTAMGRTTIMSSDALPAPEPQFSSRNIEHLSSEPRGIEHRSSEPRGEEPRPSFDSPRRSNRFQNPGVVQQQSVLSQPAPVSIPTSRPSFHPRGSKGPTGSSSRPTPYHEVHEGPVVQAAPRRAVPARSRIVGFLVSFDADAHGEVFEIRAGRWLLTSRPTDHGEFILIEDESISPLHAIIRATADGKIQVLDQLSEFGTGVSRVDGGVEEEIAGAMTTVVHGDVVRFGRRHFTVTLVPKESKTTPDNSKSTGSDEGVTEG